MHSIPISSVAQHSFTLNSKIHSAQVVAGFPNRTPPDSAELRGTRVAGVTSTRGDALSFAMHRAPLLQLSALSCIILALAMGIRAQ